MKFSEAIALRRADVDLVRLQIWIARLKNGISIEQPVAGDELRAIERGQAPRIDALTWPLSPNSVSH